MDLIAHQNYKHDKKFKFPNKKSSNDEQKIMLVSYKCRLGLEQTYDIMIGIGCSYTAQTAAAGVSVAFIKNYIGLQVASGKRVWLSHQ